MTQLTDDLFAVEVPEDVEGCEIRGEHPGRPYQLLSFYGEAEAIDLPPGTWQLLCTTKEATWLQAAGIVSSCHSGFINYGAPESNVYYQSPFDSLRSLLTSKGLDANKNYVLLKKKL